jgi:NADP-dependent 3-hydroxy acid dehydrogenase YdfG
MGTLNKSIFITGAASGIGRETALLFAKNGWFVGLYDMNLDGVKKLSEHIGADISCFGSLDVSDPNQYEKAIAHFSSFTDGKMNALFNCAGIMRMGSLDEVSLKDQLLTLRVNVEGIVIGIYSALPLLKNTPGSCILSMSSASALYGVPDLAVYSASKFAVKGLTEALNIELERSGIHVTDIMPLYVNTAMVSAQEHKAGTLDKFGADLTPHLIASYAWKAVNGSKKVHWVPTLKLKVLKGFSRIFPFVERPVMSFLSKK